MALTLEQFKELRKRGLSAQQIADFTSGKIPSKAPVNKESFIDKAEKIRDTVIGKPADFLFGSTAKTVGGTILSNVGSTKELLGKTPEEKDLGRRLRERGEEEITPTNIAFTALELFPGGGQLGKYLSKIPGGAKVASGISNFTKTLPSKLRGGAIEQFRQVLGATTKEAKRTAERVAPGLAERKITALSRESLQRKATEQTSKVGAAVEETIEAIPKGTSLKTQPIIESIEKTKQGFTVKGVVVEPGKLEVANKLQDIVKKLGDELDTDNIIKLRRVWDETIRKSGKGFGLNPKDAFSLEVKKVATNKIRNELAKEVPELAVINKEFAFWKGVKDTITGTVERTAGKKSFTQQQAGALGAAAGFIKGGAGVAVLAGVAAKNLIKLTSSTAWKTMSAKKKTQLAEAIESGSTKKINEVLKRLLAGVKNIVDQD